MAEIPFLMIPTPLQERLGPEGSRGLVELLNSLAMDRNEIRDLRQDFYKETADLRAYFSERMTREIGDLRAQVSERLTNEIGGLRAEFTERLTNEIGGLRTEFGEKLSALEVRTIREISALRAETSRSYASLLKWMFIFWVGQLGAVLGILKLLSVL